MVFYISCDIITMKTLFFLLPAFLAWFAFNPTTAVVIGIIGFAYVVMTAPMQKQKRNLILFPVPK